MSNELTVTTQSQAVESAIKGMERIGLDYGAYFPMAQLQELAGPTWGSEERFLYFTWAIGDALRQRGFGWSKKGLNNEGYRIPQKVENPHYAERCQRDAMNSLDNAITLLANTDTSGLTDAEVKRHENVLRQTQHQKLMLLRSDEAVKAIKRHKPGVLKPDVEVETETVTEA